MPRQTRWQIKRQCAQILNLTEKCIDYIAELGVLYESSHPELSAQLMAVCAGYVLCRESIEAFEAEI